VVGVGVVCVVPFQESPDKASKSCRMMEDGLQMLEDGLEMLKDDLEIMEDNLEIMEDNLEIMEDNQKCQNSSKLDPLGKSSLSL
jgi:hypothetical protein